MFKANCDVCRKVVTDLMDLKALEVRLRTKDLQHICAGCQGKLGEALARFGKTYGDKVVQDGKDWLQAHQRANSGIILP